MGVALIMNFGFSLAFGVYEVIWSLFLEDLGASIEWIGLTFALFGLPMMIVSPWAGRLVDRYRAHPVRGCGRPRHMHRGRRSTPSARSR